MHPNSRTGSQNFPKSRTRALRILTPFMKPQPVVERIAPPLQGISKRRLSTGVAPSQTSIVGGNKPDLKTSDYAHVKRRCVDSGIDSPRRLVNQLSQEDSLPIMQPDIMSTEECVVLAKTHLRNVQRQDARAEYLDRKERAILSAQKHRDSQLDAREKAMMNDYHARMVDLFEREQAIEKAQQSRNADLNDREKVIINARELLLEHARRWADTRSFQVEASDGLSRRELAVRQYQVNRDAEQNKREQVLGAREQELGIREGDLAAAEAQFREHASTFPLTIEKGFNNASLRRAFYEKSFGNQ
ncbi:hypothetical protein EDC01DRAFT_630730 [Geopyxis carbonaria]|nr:hypothetical protein EDC01DRAFT_630730 [Geopyxis carbonaria]